MLTFAETGVFHAIVDYFFRILVLCIFVRIILSWLPLPSNPISRFFGNIVDPIIEPVARRMPNVTVGFLNISYTLAIIIMWWALMLIDTLILSALPPTW
jgi:uncharacterized protein YggT (Ycf19 family)